ncbi:transposase [Enterococcus faecium]|uniref:transposase n=3 Tax=Enterococcus TaxID=1350 RepID=UPI00214BD86E|nr:transposase [Enterococcus faecium]
MIDTVRDFILYLKLCNRTLKSTNLIERLNQEVRRREKIIRIFPNQTSANRLIGAVLMDLHDEWIYSSRKYINFDK